MTAKAYSLLAESKAIPELQVIVAGTGNVGSEFLTRFSKQQQRFSGKIALQLAGIVNSRHALLASNLAADSWQRDFQQFGRGYAAADLVAYLQDLAGPKVVIDITPSQSFARQYPALIQAGCHIISANKQGVTLPDAEYQALRQQLRQHKLCWLSNTTVGAGLPVQRIIQELLQSGDQIQRISGVFSGTLSWLLCQYDGSKPFSEFVLEAQQLGYTEPDPRDDLSGKDVQRKLLVLARELGLKLDLADICLSPLLPAELAAGQWQDFWQQRELLDSQMLVLYQQAKANQQVLRYAACLSLQAGQIKAEVSLQAVALDAPLAALGPCDNIFVIESSWYHDNPLVLKGPGAGSIVTAGGLHADLAQLVAKLAG